MPALISGDLSKYFLQNLNSLGEIGFPFLFREKYLLNGKLKINPRKKLISKRLKSKLNALLISLLSPMSVSTPSA